jgi:hypothetical protein
MEPGVCSDRVSWIVIDLGQTIPLSPLETVTLAVGPMDVSNQAQFVANTLARSAY